MLDTERPDAAWVCLRRTSTARSSWSCIDRGIHLMVEKPLAADLETPVRINEAANARRGLIAGVAYHWRAMDTLRRGRRVIAERPVRLLTGHWHDNMPGAAWWRDSGAAAARSSSRRPTSSTCRAGCSARRRWWRRPHDRHDQPRHPEMTVPDARTAILRYDAGPVGAITATCILGGTSAQEVRLFCDGLAITIRQQGVLYEDARTKAVTATDGFTGSRLWGVTGDPLRADRQRPVPRRGPGVPRRRAHRRRVAAVQLATRTRCGPTG